MHRLVFEHSWPMGFATLRDTLSDNTDRQWRHSCRLLALSSRRSLEPVSSVDWAAWQRLGIETVYYHPSIHEALFVLPAEVQQLLAAPPPPGRLSCGTALPEPQPLAGRCAGRDDKCAAQHDATAEASALVLPGCKAGSDTAQGVVGFIDYVSRFVSFPSFGTWLHDLGSQGAFALTLLDRSFVSLQSKGDSLELVLTLVCRQQSCQSLKDRLLEAVGSELGCAASTWAPVSLATCPPVWPASKRRTEL